MLEQKIRARASDDLDWGLKNASSIAQVASFTFNYLLSVWGGDDTQHFDIKELFD